MMAISGTYPMLYAFYGADGALRREAFARQIAAAVASGADGIAVLGLGTEVFKLSLAERRQVVDWVVAESAGRLPVAVTIADGNMPDMADAARHAEQAGAAWLILQPPRPPASGADLITFFATVAGATRLPVAIQNAPEFLGIGLTAAELLALHDRAPNVVAVKGEAPAVVIGRMIDALDGRMAVLERPRRAGADRQLPRGRRGHDPRHRDGGPAGRHRPRLPGRRGPGADRLYRRPPAGPDLHHAEPVDASSPMAA